MEHVTSSEHRECETGQDILYVTERCVMRLGKSGLVAIETMPEIDAQNDIVEVSSGRVSIAENTAGMDRSILSRESIGVKL